MLSHCGFDLAFPRVRKCDPVRIRRVTDRFPRVKFVAAHLGSWEDWDEVERLLIGRPLHMDVSYAVDWAGRERARVLILRHPAEFMLFGTDSPWADQRLAVEQVRGLGLGSDREQLLFEGNAHQLLGIEA